MCDGLVDVNLHVNEMTLSAPVSSSKSVKAKDAIFGVCVCVYTIHVVTHGPCLHSEYMCMCSA